MIVLQGLAPNLRRAGMTQAELARRIGVSKTSVSQWIRGGMSPQADLLPKIAKELDCSIDSLFRIPLFPPAEEEDNTQFTTWRAR